MLHQRGCHAQTFATKPFDDLRLLVLTQSPALQQGLLDSLDGMEVVKDQREEPQQPLPKTRQRGVCAHLVMLANILAANEPRVAQDQIARLEKMRKRGENHNLQDQRSPQRSTPRRGRCTL